MSSVDTLITSDLAALGEDSRRSPVGLDDTLQAKNMYRDDLPGAEARRDALADDRRRELVTMPLVLSHVFAHRVGRAAAGAAALVSTLVLVTMLGDPLLMSFAAWAVPGLNMGMLALLAALAILGVYVIAAWIAEAWFARRMRDAIRTGNDPYRDLDELARGPVEVAQHAVRRVDGLSMGLFLGGMTAIALAFGYLGVIVSSLQEFPAMWSITGILHTGTLEKNLDILVFALAGATGVALFVGRACQRPQSSLISMLGHTWTLAGAFVIGVVTLYIGAHTLALVEMRKDLPSTDLRYLLAIGTLIAIVGTFAWTLLWWRRREQRRIGD